MADQVPLAKGEVCIFVDFRGLMTLRPSHLASAVMGCIPLIKFTVAYINVLNRIRGQGGDSHDAKQLV
jgi:hypothetical protein